MSKTDLDKAEIEQLWRMIAIPDLMRNGFLAVGQELIKRDAEIDRLTAENMSKDEELIGIKNALRARGLVTFFRF